MGYGTLYRSRFGAKHGASHLGALPLADDIAVARDGPLNWYVPAAAADYTLLNITPPNSGLWQCQDAAGPAVLADTLGLMNLAQGGTVPSYQQAVAGWSRVGVQMADASSSRFSVGAGVGPDPSVTSVAWLWYLDMTACGGTRQNCFATATGGGSFFVRTTVTPRMQCVTSHGTQTSPTVDPVTPGMLAILMVINHALSRVRLYTNLEQFVGSYGAFLDGIKGVGGSGGATPTQTVVYGAHWSGADAEAVDDKITLQRLNIVLPY